MQEYINRLRIQYKVALTRLLLMIPEGDLMVIGSLADYFNLPEKGIIPNDIDIIVKEERSLDVFKDYNILVDSNKPEYNKGFRQYYSIIEGVTVDITVMSSEVLYNNLDKVQHNLYGFRISSNSPKRAIENHNKYMRYFTEEVVNNYRAMKHSSRLVKYNLWK